MADQPRLPDPALVVLIGASGSGKSTWARARYRNAEIVSSDELRGVVGSGRHDLDASADAFRLLDQIVAGRLRRGLTTVVDSLGLESNRRRGQLEAARSVGLPAVTVAFDSPAAVCRTRNARRDRPVPARVLADQLKTFRSVHQALGDEGWDAVVTVTSADIDGPDPAPVTTDAPAPASAGSGGLDVVLQVSRFPWGEDPVGWMKGIALAAAEAGYSGIALMDHLIQIPQVGSAWEPIPEPYVVLGMLAGLDTHLRLGTLVTPVTFRPPGIVAKTVATLDVISGGRAFCGIGAGWWAREHQANGLPFPSARERLDLIEPAVETMRALWGAGTKAYAGEHVSLPETTSYPRPLSTIPVIVGGGGERRTLRIAARVADGCNVSSEPATLDRKRQILRGHCADVGRDPDDVALTVLDLPVVGRDREAAWEEVERLRGRTPAATYVRRHPVGTPAEHRARYEELAAGGVRTVFVAIAGLSDPEELLRHAAMLPA
jgi:alkanesulfonate monooxygenase SsuD/methylene tetrahydromethanopterin reductase-like flavin-dependent oxidoreductase (luciferase family)/predicted kinase